MKILPSPDPNCTVQFVGKQLCCNGNVILHDAAQLLTDPYLNPSGSSIVNKDIQPLLLIRITIAQRKLPLEKLAGNALQPHWKKSIGKRNA